MHEYQARSGGGKTIPAHSLWETQIKGHHQKGGKEEESGIRPIFRTLKPKRTRLGEERRAKVPGQAREGERGEEKRSQPNSLSIGPGGGDIARGGVYALLLIEADQVCRGEVGGGMGSAFEIGICGRTKEKKERHRESIFLQRSMTW